MDKKLRKDANKWHEYLCRPGNSIEDLEAKLDSLLASHAVGKDITLEPPLKTIVYTLRLIMTSLRLHIERDHGWTLGAQESNETPRMDTPEHNPAHDTDQIPDPGR
jgi:hypothetical protein